MNAIVVAVDAHADSLIAAQHGARVANARGVSLHLVTAVRHSFSGTVENGNDEWFLDSFDIAKQMLVDLGQHVAPTAGFSVAVVRGSLRRALCQQAKLIGSSAIVLGEPSAKRSFLNKTELRLLQRTAPCDVLAVSSDELSTVATMTDWTGLGSVVHHRLSSLLHPLR